MFIILRNNFKAPYLLNISNENKHFNILLSEDVIFLNKASILKTLNEIPHDSFVIIDASKTHFTHHDIIEIIEDFVINSKTKNIDFEIIDLYKDKQKTPLKHFVLKASK